MKNVHKCVWLALAMTLLFGAGCNGKNHKTEEPAAILYTGFEPVDPEIVGAYTDFSRYPEAPLVSWLKLSPAEIRKLLPDSLVEVIVRKKEADGRVTYLSGNAKLSTGSYEIWMDAFRYRPERVVGDRLISCPNGQVSCPERLAMVKLGVGVRLYATVEIDEAEADTGTLIPLGIKAKGKSVSGRLVVNSFGIDPKVVSINMPVLSLDLSDAAVQSALQALNTMRSRIDDSDVTLTPHVFAVKTTAPPAGTVSPERLIKNFNSIMPLTAKTAAPQAVNTDR